MAGYLEREAPPEPSSLPPRFLTRLSRKTTWVGLAASLGGSGAPRVS